MLAEGAVLTSADVLEKHAIGGVKPRMVCEPEDELHASRLITMAAAEHIPVIPYGSGTAQGIGLPPPPQSLFLSTRSLSHLIKHEPGDMVATAQAGMSLSAFQNELAKNGQWLPLDGHPDATLGGLLASDHQGALAHGYGTLRDMVLGMTVVNGDGVIRK